MGTEVTDCGGSKWQVCYDCLSCLDYSQCFITIESNKYKDKMSPGLRLGWGGVHSQVPSCLGAHSKHLAFLGWMLFLELLRAH